MITALAHTTTTTTEHSESIGAGLGIAIVVIGLFFFVLFLGLFVFWVVMLADAVRRKNWPNGDQRTLWLIILVASLFMQVWWVAAVIYYFAMKKPLDEGRVPNFFSNQSVPPTSKPHTRKKS